MTKFAGNVGFGVSSEIRPGVWQDVITERAYFGDVVKINRRLREGEALNPNLTVGESISIVADAFAEQNFVNLRYVEWMGARWTVTTVDVERPRLLLRLGEVYNGPTT